jgi:oligopeptide transport system substrate-binding protein
MQRISRFFITAALAMSVSAAFAEDEPQAPRVFTLAASPRQFSLDPLHAFTSFESQFYTAIYEGLVVNNPFTLEPMPGIAARWELSGKDRIYRFYLRPDAVYSDGRPVRAQDFVDSWMRMIDPASKAEYSFLFDPIAGARAYRNGTQKDPKKVGIRAVSDKILEVELEKPAGYFLKVLCHISFLPVYPTYLKNTSWGNAKSVIGDGPYIITKRTEAEIVLDKNMLYWDEKNVMLDRIVIKFMSDAAEATDAFLAGSVDWSEIYPTNKVQDSGKVVVMPLFSTSYFYFICDKPPWNDWRVRRGLALLVPWEQIRSSETYMYPDSKLVPSIPSYPEVKGISGQQTGEALKLLAEAGFAGGKGLPPLQVKIGASGLDEVKKMAEVWEKEIGLKTEIKTISSGDDYFAEIKKADFTLGDSTWIGDYADPLTFLQLWTTDSNLNDAHFSDSEYDTAVTDALTIQDTAGRYKKLAQAEEVLLSKAAILPLSHAPAVHLIDLDRIDGWYPNILDIHPFKFIGFKEQKAPAGVAMME